MINKKQIKLIALICAFLLDSLLTISPAFSSTTSENTAPSPLIFGGKKLGYGDKLSFIHLNRGNPLALALAARFHKAAAQTSDFVLAPAENITIALPHGKLKLEKDAIAYVVDTGDGVVIYNLHDSHRGSVSYREGHDVYELNPGQMLAAIEKPVKSIKDVPLDLKLIPLRGVTVTASSVGSSVMEGDFSEASVLLQIDKLRTLRYSKNSEDRRIADKVLKTAACISLVCANGEAYSDARQSSQ